MGALRGARTRTSYLIVQVGYLRNPPLAVSLTRLTGALLTTNPLCNNRLVIDWRRCAWKYEQLRKTSLYVPLCSFMAGTRAFAIFLISVHKSFMIEVLE